MTLNLFVLYIDEFGNLHMAEPSEEGRKMMADPSAEMSPFWTNFKMVSLFTVIFLIIKRTLADAHETQIRETRLWAKDS